MLRRFEGREPVLGARVYVDESAMVLGDVVLGDDCSVWPNAVIRGDIHAIRVGPCTNVQDGAILHVTHDSRWNPGGFPLVIGREVTLGHAVVLHGCTVEDRCLVGMGSVVMDGALVGQGTILGAGSLVPPGKVIEGGYLWVGRPAQRVRPLTEEEASYLEYAAAHYVSLKERHLCGERPG